jgi:glycosyltransferase involved in cell wall biosynthesis
MTRSPGGQEHRQRRLLIFIVAYSAERTVEQVLARIPLEQLEARGVLTEILIIDDASGDATFERASLFKHANGSAPITVLQNPRNLGYGGNQKVGYRYAIDNGFDFVALLHGDGQYAPEELPRLVEPLLSEECGAVFGSRMLTPGAARKGGMPLYKFVGNKILTWVQNGIVGTGLSEYHSGYRLYSCAALSRLPFELNADGFDFDTDIIIQLHAGGFNIGELPVPTFYGDEICHVNGVRYAAAIVWVSVLSRLQKLGLFYDPRFDIETDDTPYRPKFDFASSHSYALARVRSTDSLLLLGSGPAELAQPFAERAAFISAIDQQVDAALSQVCDQTVQADLNSFEFDSLLPDRSFSKVLALDVIEHLASPEDFLRRLRESVLLEDAEFVFTTANIGFLPMRAMLLLGFFNYGKSGILDRTHTRLFTFSSLRMTFTQAGFDISEVRGIPAPYPLALGRESVLGRLLLSVNRLLVEVWPALFSYQMLIAARPRPTVTSLLRSAIRHSDSKGASLLVRAEQREKTEAA